MNFNGKKIPFPAITQVSFFKVIESLKEQASDPDPNVAVFANRLLADCEQYPQLTDGINSGDFDPNVEIVQRLCRVLFPDILLTNEIKGVMAPFEFTPFYLSTRFKNILESSGGEFSLELNDLNEDQIYIYGCASILASHFKYAIPSGSPIFVNIHNKKLDVIRTYRLAMNADLMEMVPTDKAKDITREDYLELLDNFDNIQLWKEKFPPDSWIMRGIGITNLMDVTFDSSLATITANLLSTSANAIEKIHEGLRSLFGIKDLGIGFLAYHNDKFIAHKKEGFQSLMLKDQEMLSCPGNLCNYSYDVLFKKKEILIISDVERFDKLSNSQMSHLINDETIKSYLIAPIHNGIEFLGFLELSSPRKYDLNGASIEKLDTIMPILGMAISRFKREEQNRVEAIIQQECTTIHPSVKWRFEEEAVRFIKREMNAEQPVFNDIVFKNVFPLYGQLDIKGSSEKRNLAVRADLTKQLTEVRKVLERASEKTKMPIYEHLAFRVNAFQDELDSEFLSGSEPRIIGFLETEIHPVLDQLKIRNSGMKGMIDAYTKLLHPELNSIYDLRQKYDSSVNVINQALASLLDERQVEAQAMFPHYFERYKTDGVEYNMYVGQSISNEVKFDEVFQHNLQLWQLMVTCELEYKFREIKTLLDSDIEIASLILVYNTSLSVHFRMDEKRFDVEGAYNARYEIVKKRIDKAHIKGTNERITTPCKMAIIYSSDQDAITYTRYLDFLAAKGYVKENSIEMLEVEDLQGISGLKAIRVAVNYDNDKLSDKSFNINEILEGVTRSYSDPS